MFFLLILASEGRFKQMTSTGLTAPNLVSIITFKFYVMTEFCVEIPMMIEYSGGVEGEMGVFLFIAKQAKILL